VATVTHLGGSTSPELVSRRAIEDRNARVVINDAGRDAALVFGVGRCFWPLFAQFVDDVADVLFGYADGAVDLMRAPPLGPEFRATAITRKVVRGAAVYVASSGLPHLELGALTL
jgi:hypothetical protein